MPDPARPRPVGPSPSLPEPYAHVAAAPPAPDSGCLLLLLLLLLLRSCSWSRTAPAVPTRVPTPAAAPTREVPPWRRDLTRWTARTRTTIKSDLAVHGLAYLGVLLLFAGVFGFVAFAFGAVGSNWRPVAEVMIPVALFGSARFLRTRGAPFVAVALEALGGAVVPIVVIAAFVDGSDVPPDLTGTTLAFTLAGSLFAVAGIYAWIATRREGSPLRYLVAPVVWLGVAMGALATVPAFRGGQAVARPQPASMAVTAVAVLVTAVLVRRSRHVLAIATDAVVLPGIAVVAGLEVAAAATHGWPVWPSFVTALAVFGVVEIERRRLGTVVTPVVEALALAAALAALAPEIGWPWVGALGVPLFLAFGEWVGRRDASAVTLWAALVPASAALVVATGAPGAMVLAFASASIWVHTRRLLPVGWLPRAVTQDPIVALLPLGIAVGIFDALPLADATLLVAAVLAVGAVAVRLSPARVDPLWTWWFPAASVAVLSIAVVAASEASRLGTAGEGWYPVALGAHRSRGHRVDGTCRPAGVDRGGLVVSGGDRRRRSPRRRTPTRRARRSRWEASGWCSRPRSGAHR